GRAAHPRGIDGPVPRPEGRARRLRPDRRRHRSRMDAPAPERQARRLLLQARRHRRRGVARRAPEAVGLVVQRGGPPVPRELVRGGGETMDKELRDKGLAVRKEVLGAEYVERSLATADGFNRPFQELVTDYCWGAVWAREGLSRKSRSILNLGMLS